MAQSIDPVARKNFIDLKKANSAAQPERIGGGYQGFGAQFRFKFVVGFSGSLPEFGKPCQVSDGVLRFLHNPNP